MNVNNPFLQLIKLIIATIVMLFGISGLLRLIPPQPASQTRLTISATFTPPATPTTTATPSAIPSATPTSTASATSLATFTVVPSPTETEIAVAITPLPTSILPAETLILAANAFTATLTISVTHTATPSGPPTETPTPTVTPTPVPRTVKAEDLPDHTLAQPHLWFTRPYTDAHATWGSYFYPYGTNNNGLYLWHHGSDIGNPQNTPIVAIGDGVVVWAGPDDAHAIGPQTNFYGQAVVIEHNRTLPITNFATNETQDLLVYTLYGHVSQTLVQVGENVSMGQSIALTGQGGVALGPHLHLEIRLNQNTYFHTQNPDLWIRPDLGYGVITGRVIDANGYYVPQQLVTLHRAETPSQFWRQTRTYPDNRYLPDPQLDETFTFADVPVGNYLLKTRFDGHTITLPVIVNEQAISFVSIVGSAPVINVTKPSLGTPTPSTP